jgi:hypothetical protein
VQQPPPEHCSAYGDHLQRLGYLIDALILRDKAGHADLYRLSQRLGVRNTGEHQHLCPQMVLPN